MESFGQRSLGNTGVTVGRLGVAGGYGAPAEAYEMAFERGCNYFYWSSPRKKGMGTAIKNICRNGKRDDLVIVLQTYSRSGLLMEYFFNQGLKDLGLDSVDVMLLGWHNRPPSRKILEKAKSMQAKGMFRFLAVSGHKRTLFPELAQDENYDIFHFRYNPAHRGAEKDIFEQLDPEQRPGTVSYTATRWGHLLKQRKMPQGESPLEASDCYRFALTNPNIDVCICGPSNIEQMKQALQTLERGPLDSSELDRIKSIGDFVHQKSRRF